MRRERSVNMKYPWPLIILSAFLNGCATQPTQAPGLAAGAIAAATAGREERNRVAAEGAPETSECEREQRAHIFVASLPPVALYVAANKVWMDFLRSQGIEIDTAANLNPCVRNPYAAK